MSIGVLTKYGLRGKAGSHPTPARDKKLSHDRWRACEICGWEYPEKTLRLSRIRKQLVCPDDHDQPAVSDVDNLRKRRLAWATRFDHRNGMRF